MRDIDIKKKKIIENYWLDRLSGNLPKILLPLIYIENENKGMKKAQIFLEIPGKIIFKLEEMANHSDVGLFILFLSGLNILLNKYTGIEDLVIGTLSPGKDQVKNNILFCRNRVSGHLTFKEVIIQTRQTIIEAFNYSDYSFGTVYQKLLTSNGTGTLDIFNVAFISDEIQNRIKVLQQFDLVFVLSHQENRRLLQIEFNSNLYSSKMVHQFSRNLINMFDNISGKMEQRVSKMKVLCNEEEEELFELNKTGTKYPDNKTIHELFEEQVKKTPDNIAVVGGGAGEIALTYNQLNQKANRLARLFREKGVKDGTIVGIMLHRSVEMIASLIAVLKASGTYLPIDPETPEKRIISMLDDCNASFLLTDNSILETHSFTYLQGLRSLSALIHLTPPQRRITDFDGLSFPNRSLVDYEKYNHYIGQAIVKNRIIIQASRGCPYDCSYCYRIWPRKQAARSGENIFQEIMLYYNIGLRKFDIFMMNIKQGRRLFELIIKNKLDDIQLYFPNGFRGDLLTKEYIDLMVKAGTVNLALALETASPRLQKLINKHLNLEKFRENIDYICEKYPHVILELFTIHGIPTETQEEAAMTLEFIKKIKWIHFPYVNVLKIYSNTEMEKLAFEHGISKKSILRAENMAWHEWSDTLPFSREFTAQYQAEFLSEYVLSKERLLSVLPYQMKVLSENEFLQKYDSYLPNDIESFDDFLETAQVHRDELGNRGFRDEKEDEKVLQDLNERIKRNFPIPPPSKNALRVLLLDLSQYFTGKSDALYDVVDPPLGLMYILTYLNAKWGKKIHGRILKSRVDFDSYDELKELLEEFQPDVIGIRTLSYYKDFFHQTVAAVRQWGIDVPIIIGGPYATVNYKTILQDRNIDLAVLGEGELTFCEIITKIMEKNRKLPDQEALKEIPGIAFAAVAGKLPQKFAREIIILDELSHTFPGKSDTNLESLAQAQNLAYIIFTSGSTGNPKGVPIEHRNAVNVLTWFGKTYNLQADTHVIQLTNNTFDPSVEQIFAALLHGAVLYVPRKDIAADKEEFAQYIEQNQINLINFVPGILKDLLDREEKLKSLDIVISGGEKLEESIKNRFIEKGYRLYNQYGPTETTIDALAARCTRERVTLGKPISNVKCYILGEDNHFVPIGVVGELYIGGVGVSRGYLNNPELTAEKFVPNYFKNRDILYNTGDFARWLLAMEVEFLGRKDHQVKVRGYRIELGEIENLLMNHPSIKTAVVLPGNVAVGSIDDGANTEKYLCAYIVSDKKEVKLELRNYLRYELPDYMIPLDFLQIDKMPLTLNGKIDRKALLELKIGRQEEQYVAPGDKYEKKIVEIWSELLEIKEDMISSEGNFFKLGGHSLKATRLILKIHKEFNVKPTLAEIFKRPTIKELSQYVKEMKKDVYVSIEAAQERDYYLLSPAQKRLYILQQMELDGVSYNVPIVVKLEGKLDQGKLDKTFRKLIERHESLRTSFEVVEDEPVQKIHQDVDFKIEYYEAWNIKHRVQDEECRGESMYSPLEVENIITNFVRPFDLSQSPLMRVRLIKLGKEKHILMMDMHHIITDGTSMDLFIKEFIVVYAGKELPPLRLQYKGYSVWQNSEAANEAVKSQEEYWLKQFEGEIPVLDLPTDYARPSVQSFEGDVVRFELPPEQSRALTDMALNTEMTLYMLLLAIYNILLAKISGQEDIVVGIPTAGRRHADLEKIIGMFVNTLAMRNYPEGHKTFQAFLIEIKERTLEAFENQDYPLENLVEKVAVNRDANRNPLFDTMFGLPNMGTRTGPTPGLEIPDLKISPYKSENNTAKFDLTLTFFEMGKTMFFAFNYCTKLFKRESIERFLNYFKIIISNVLEDIDKKISLIEVISEDEKKRILFDFNDTKREYPSNKTIHELFEQQVEKKSGSIAVEGVGPINEMPQQQRIQITYRELNKKSNRLAELLKEKGVKPDTIVGIMSERSIGIIIGILGIMKSGGAYLPIDPEYPQERINYILEDSRVKILLTDRALTNMSQVGGGGGILFLKGFAGAMPRMPAESRLGVSKPAASLAYVIYTSGSTGRPKGVMVEHKNVVRLVRNISYINWMEGDKLLPTGTIAFDITTFEIWGPLLNRLTLVLIDQVFIMDVEKLGEILSKHQISILHLVPQLFNQLAEQNPGIFAALNWLLVGGDLVRPYYINIVRNRNKRLRILHMYGPTENTTFSTFLPIEKDYQVKIPIGKPISNSSVYIIDKYNQLVPIGVSGELILGGDGAARGYLNNPELTTEKFIKLTLATNTLYKTGDFARWLPGGIIEYLGRQDHQVKIRGIRIELGEIENHLLNHGNIKEAVVVDRKGKVGENQLAAYIVVEKENQFDAAQLRDYLSKKLPLYMIPSYFIGINKIPLTSNRKIDRKALPEPEIKAGEGYIAPGNKTQEKLVEIWSEVLGIEKNLVSIDANFFRLGGHSLKATIMTAKVHKELDVKIPLAMVFKTPSIRELSGSIKGLKEEKYASIGPTEKREFYPLSSAQKRLYVLQQMVPASTAYNMPNIIPLAETIDIEKMEETFRQLIARHESLRTSFEMIEGEPVQKVHDEVEFRIDYCEVEKGKKITGDTLGKEKLPTANCQLPTVSDFVRPFDISQAPLLRVGLIKLPHTPTALRGHPCQEGKENKCLLMVDIHHSISDGMSHQILVQDFYTLYAGKVLPGLRLHYKDYSQWQQSQKVRNSLKQQKEYWLKAFEGEIPVLKMCYDYPRPVVQGFEGSITGFELNAEETSQLNEITRLEGDTLFMVLLALYNIFLTKISSHEDIVVGTPIAGRRHVDLEQIIGMFVNTLALRNYPSGRKTFITFLREIRENILEAFENQDYPFEDLVENVSVGRDTGRNPLFDVVFVLQNISVDPGQISPEAMEDTKTNTYSYDNKTSKFDLSLCAVERGEKLYLSFEYCTKLFKEETILRFIQYFKKVISSVVENPQKKISEIEVISEEEKKQILYDYNNTRSGYPKDKTLHELFEEQVESTPDNIALVGAHQLHELHAKLEGTRGLAPLSGSVSITYKELNQKSDQLAHLLGEKGVLADTIVGIMVKRSIQMLVGILGILKSGGAYLPIDHEYPEERINYILLDSNIRILVTTRNLSEKIASEKDIVYPEDYKGLPPGTGQPAAGNQQRATSLAYIIYTSGSTGRPKGVMVEHKNVVKLVRNTNYINWVEGDKLLLSGPIAFDITTFEIWAPLLNRLTLVLVNQDFIMDADKLGEILAEHQISILHLIPQLFNQLVDPDPGIFERLDWLLVGGDLVRPHYINIVRNRNKRLRILHMYGPTENTTFSTFLPVDKDYEIKIPIGKPVSNSTAYIIDNNERLKPIGTVGELAVGGDGLAWGYLNNPELTAEKFIKQVTGAGDRCRWESDRKFLRGSRGRFLQKEPPGRRRQKIYRTGDLARWLPDGNIEFIGRKDQQVKIRGIRIELGEIEKVLRKHPEIDDCVVISRNMNEDTQLVAYYKKRNKIELWPSLAEYFVYDDLIYYSMTQDESRNEKYRNAINKVIKDKTVMEIGPGNEAILSRMCIDGGAKKVYAVEKLEEAYRKAKETIKKLGLDDRIILIHGDVRDVQLPEPVDYCISEIVGSIGGSEGAAKIINRARCFLKDPTCMIPSRSLTKITAITLPDSQFEGTFEEVGAYYTEKIFKHVGYKFDLRLCLFSFPSQNVISTSDVFEDLNFTKENLLEDQHEIYLEIQKNSILHGFIVWLNLYLDDEELIDSLENKYIWLPIYLPVFPGREKVERGDYIRAEVTRKLSDNGLNPDFTLEGRLYKRGGKSIDFIYHCPHLNLEFKGNRFYEKILSHEEDRLKISKKLTVDELRIFLSSELPDYMVPSHFVPIEKIPVTTTGKLDRKALPEPEVTTGDNYVAPTNEVEKILLNLWSEVLGIEKGTIGIESNFFNLGGHSLKATMLVSKIHKALNVKVPLAEIFRIPFIRELSWYINRAHRDKYISIEPTEKKDYYPSSSPQKRLYFLQQMEVSSNAYNIPQVVVLEGTIETSKLEETFSKLIERHGSFRTSFEIIDDEPVQRIYKTVDFEIEYYQAGAHHSLLPGEEQESDGIGVCVEVSSPTRNFLHSPHSTEDIINNFVRPFDLSQAPLLRVGMIATEDEKHILMADMHHIISDGVSHNMLIKEFWDIYHARKLPGLKLQYKDYSEWRKSYRVIKAIKKQESYWSKQFEGNVPVLNLPTDYARPSFQGFEGDSIRFEIGMEETKALNQISLKEGATLFMVLLAIYNVLLAKITGQEDIVIGCPIAGRRHPDLEKIIGLFLNTLALRNYPKAEKIFREFLNEVKENTLNGFENQDYQFEELVDKVVKTRDINRNPLFQVLFNFQNISEPNIETNYSEKKDNMLDVKIVGHQFNTSKFDLELRILESNGKLLLNLEYSTKLFKKELIELFIEYFKNIVSSVIEDPKKKISRIGIESEKGKEEFLSQFNDDLYDESETLRESK